MTEQQTAAMIQLMFYAQQFTIILMKACYMIMLRRKSKSSKINRFYTFRTRSVFS
ncbi:hypothetical protein [uncultured Brachyspira sp.]|uniref:hypothetical protein n=1 Tax=uncultured Brachyspira sp. TaxID=221953 RepID=UPI00261E022E|nr:hypothetical protein [uncultured Brachyspira sp.]